MVLAVHEVGRDGGLTWSACGSTWLEHVRGRSAQRSAAGCGSVSSFIGRLGRGAGERASPRSGVTPPAPVHGPGPAAASRECSLEVREHDLVEGGFVEHSRSSRQSIKASSSGRPQSHRRRTRLAWRGRFAPRRSPAPGYHDADCSRVGATSVKRGSASPGQYFSSVSVRPACTIRTGTGLLRGQAHDARCRDAAPADRVMSVMVLSAPGRSPSGAVNRHDGADDRYGLDSALPQATLPGLISVR